MKKNNYIVKTLNKLYPNISIFLNHKNVFELLIAVSLSAQTTDIKVNKVTNILFKNYPTCIKLSKASQNDIEKILMPLGLYRNKAKNIINLSKKLIENFNGEVPSNKKDLMTLDGVGNKTASIIMMSYFNSYQFPVDTHIFRISKRLAIAENFDSIEIVEEKLKQFFDKKHWFKLHHQIILFGRNICDARKPKCQNCPLIKYCTTFEKVV